MNIPPNSKFSFELRTLFKHYLKYAIKPAQEFRKKVEFNFNLFNKLIPHSCLIEELREKFLLGEEVRNKAQSVFFEMTEEEKAQQGYQEEIYDAEIRKYYDVLGVKLSERNMDELC